MYQNSDQGLKLIKPNEQVKHPPVGRWDAQTARTPYPKSLSPLLAQSANWLKSPNGLLRANTRRSGPVIPSTEYPMVNQKDK
jgi:hypothetical protein